MKSCFIANIEKQKAYSGTPKAGSAALKAFYKIIENAVTNVIKKLNEEGDERLIANTIIDYLRDAYQCGGKIFTISIEIFNKVVHNVQPNFENRAFSSLGELRELVARDAIPQGAQSVHDYNKFLYAKGKTLGIPGSFEAAQFHDRYVGTRGFSVDKAEEKFLKLYTPSTAVLKWLWIQLKTDAALREHYTDFWLNHVPKKYKGQYEEIRLKLAKLRKKRANNKKISEFLKKHEIYTDKNLKPEQAIESLRKHDFVEREVYDDMAANTFKKKAFAQALTEIAVLSKHTAKK